MYISDGKGSGTFAGALHKNILDCGYGNAISLIISDSVTASRLFGDASVDWVHLDARHDYQSVKADIQAWLPKVKRGGWLSGDDYDEIKWPEVVKAVDALMASPGLRLDMGKNARTKVEREFTLARQAEAWADCLEKLC